MDAGGGVPPDVEDALSQLALLAAASNLVKARTDDERAIAEAAEGPATGAPAQPDPSAGLGARRLPTTDAHLSTTSGTRARPSSAARVRRAARRRRAGS